MYFFAGLLEEEYRYAFQAWKFLKAEGYMLFGALAIGVLAAAIPAIGASRTDISTTLSVE